MEYQPPQEILCVNFMNIYHIVDQTLFFPLGFNEVWDHGYLNKMDFMVLGKPALTCGFSCFIILLHASLKNNLAALRRDMPF